MQEITKQLNAWKDGDPQALETVIPLIDKELRKTASRYLRYEGPGHLLQTTALVHEALIKLIRENFSYRNRKHFYVLVAKRMRQVLIDYARRANQVDFADVDVEGLSSMRSKELIKLDAALEEFAKNHPRKVRVVECCFFVGMTLEETADQLNLSKTTVERDWRFARAWLKRAMQEMSK